MEKRCCGCMQIKTQSPLCELCGYNENIDNLSHQLPVDTVLNGRYRLGKVLGQGGFGITYIGWDQQEEAAVAVKEYYPKTVVERDVSVSKEVSCKDEEGRVYFRQYRDKFLQEAKLLEKFAHIPQVVRVKTVFEENNTVYIAMEHVRGTDLRMYLRMGGIMSGHQTFYIFRPLMEALIKVHESGLVHKDISPDNIMILPDGKAKLLDFGAAQDIFQGMRHEEQKSGVAVVKHGFAPPEQYNEDSDLGPWTDVYALCATMYYCVTGKLLKPAQERMEDKTLSWENASDLTPGQIAALTRGMEPWPENRFYNVAELYEALFGPPVQKGQKLVWEDAPPEKPEKPKKKIPKIVPIAAAACVAVAVAVGGFLSVPRGWKQESGITCYYRGGDRVTGMQTIDGKTYLFGDGGAMLTGWQEVEGKQYLFGEDGVMYSGDLTLDGMDYRFAEDGSFLYRIRSMTAAELASSESEDKVPMKKKNGGTQSWTFRQLAVPVENCTYLAAEMEMTEYKNGNADQWEFAYRDLEGNWHILGESFGLTGDKAKREWNLEEPISFDAYVWYCVSIGNMWNFDRSYGLTAITVLDYEI